MIPNNILSQLSKERDKIVNQVAKPNGYPMVRKYKKIFTKKILKKSIYVTRSEEAAKQVRN